MIEELNCEQVYRMPDGTLVRHNATGDVDVNALNAWADAHPDKVLPLPINLDAVRESLCDEVDASLVRILARGGKYGTQGQHIQADEIAVTNLNGYLTMDSLGALEYPLIWKTFDNSYFPMANASELKAVIVAVGSFRREAYTKVFKAKDDIRASQTVDVAESIKSTFDVWESSL